VPVPLPWGWTCVDGIYRAGLRSEHDGASEDPVDPRPELAVVRERREVEGPGGGGVGRGGGEG
jgi:hypothetical protein